MFPESPCGAHCLPADPRDRRVGRLTRVVRYAGLAGLLLLAPVVTTRAVRPLAGDLRWWFRGVLAVLGVRVVVRGADRLSAGDGGTLVVANHTSWLDNVVLPSIEWVRPLAKIEVAGWPVVGEAARRTGAVFVDRGRLRALPATIAALADALHTGDAVLAFPEGTTWCGSARGTFRRAAFQAAVDARAAVRPVGLSYRIGGRPTTSAAFVGPESLLTSVRRVVAADGLTVEVHIRPVLRPGSADRALLATVAEAEIANALHDGAGASHAGPRCPADSQPTFSEPEGAVQPADR